MFLKFGQLRLATPTNYAANHFFCALVWFCSVCVSHGDCFTDGEKSNNASLVMFSVRLRSAISLTLGFYSVWTNCDALRA